MYKVKFYEGDYHERQTEANSDNCVAYVEHHFNSFSSPLANYTVVVTGSNASQVSRNWGRWYASAVANEFDIPIGGDGGILVGGFEGRGDGNLKYTDMPAILLEPLFCSNLVQAQWIRSSEGQGRLAKILCESFERMFPGGGLIGFSVGHKYKNSHPNDRGAMVAGGGTEADYAEKTLKLSARMLGDIKQISGKREIRVMQDGSELTKLDVDIDAQIKWDPVREVLHINKT